MDLFYLVFFPGKIITKRNIHIRNIYDKVQLQIICVAAAAAKSLQSCPTLCNPIDGSLSGSTVPWILQARTLEWVAISFSNAWKLEKQKSWEVNCETEPTDKKFLGE